MSDTPDQLLALAAVECQVSPDQIQFVCPATRGQQQNFQFHCRTRRFGEWVIQIGPNTNTHRLRQIWNDFNEKSLVFRTRLISDPSSGALLQVALQEPLHWHHIQDDPNDKEHNCPRPWRNWDFGKPLAHLFLQDNGPTNQRLILQLHHAICNPEFVPALLRQVSHIYQCGNSTEVFPSPAISSLPLTAWERQPEMNSPWATSFPDARIGGDTPRPAAYIEELVRIEPDIARVVQPTCLEATFMLAWGMVQSQYQGVDNVTFAMVAADNPEGRLGPVDAIYRHRIQFSPSHDRQTTVEKRLKAISAVSGDIEDPTSAESTLLSVYRQANPRKLLSNLTFGTLLRCQGDHVGGDRALSLGCWVFEDRDYCFIARYEPQLIESSQIKRILAQLLHVFTKIFKGPQTMVHDIRTVSEKDLTSLRWGAISSPVFADICVHDLIRRRCLEEGDRQAVCAWDGSWTFRELWVQAMAMALALRQRDIRADTFVPICMEKSRWTSVAILGVIQAGAAFVLLDPTHPLERLRAICHMVDAHHVVCSGKTATLGRQLACEIIDVCSLSATPTEDIPGRATQSSNALYAVFTSGSTGNPKGVVIEHRSYCAGALAHIPVFGLGPSARVLQFASYAFDVSIMETLSTWIAGGCLCVPSDNQRTDAAALQKVLDIFRVSHAFLTPTVARLLSIPKLPALETLILGGECMSTSDVSAWQSRVRVMNAYGPAECTINATIQPDVNPACPRNIGFPTGARCWVVDAFDCDHLAPIGAVGELLLEGPIVGRGYLRDPVCTAAAFIDPPRWRHQFQPFKTERMYRTGDLVQQQDDGSLIYVGRRDNQVKIRGQRVELGEIEHRVQCALGDGSTVVVDAVTRPPSPDPILVAFACQPGDLNAVPQADTDIFMSLAPSLPNPDVLRQYLPHHMVPMIYLRLAWLPRTATGKVDRKLLREKAAALGPQDGQIPCVKTAASAKQPPSTDAERGLQDLFARVLKMSTDQIGVDDNFFSLGGNSILAIKLVGEAGEAGMSLDFAQIQDMPTVRELARCIGSRRLSERATPIAPFSMLASDVALDEVMTTAQEQCSVSRESIEDIYPCTALQEGMLFLTLKESSMYTGDIHIQLLEGTDLLRLQQAWLTTVEANPILRTRFIQTSSGIYQVVLSVDAASTWDSSSRPARKALGVFGGCLSSLKLATSKNRLTWTLHHALCDGWSLPLILNQVQAAYKGRSLPYRPFTPFINFSAQQPATTNFWASQFAGFNGPIFPSLPFSSYTPCPTASAVQYVDLPHMDPPSVTLGLASWVQMAWAIVVSHHTDTGDVVFGITLNGRTAALPGIATMTGPTITTVPLRVKMQSHLSVLDSVQAIQHTVNSLHPYEQAGLPAIAQVSVEAQRACQFQSHLGVQMPNELLDEIVFHVDPETLGPTMDYRRFSTYAIVLIVSVLSGGQGVSAKMHYDPAITNELEAQRMLDQFAHTLQELSSAPSKRIDQIDIATPQDLRQLALWNRYLPTPEDRCLYDRVLDHCLQMPSACAVDAWDGQLTYEELGAFSAHGAHLLISKYGIGRGSLVPICVDRSRWAIVAMLSVLRAGAACVLLDVGHPRHRMQDIVRQTRAELLIASNATESLVQNITSQTVLVSSLAQHNMNSTSSIAISTSAADPIDIADPADPAFIIFTSGSTGTPKGIIMSHRSLATSIKHHAPGMNINPRTRALHFCSYAFDASIYEIFSTLSSGGCVCVPSSHDRMNNLASFIREKRVNWLTMAPSSLHVLHPDEVPDLQTVTVGGEAVTQEIVEVWARKVNLINGYGPAEATICALGKIPETGWQTGDIGHVVGAVPWITLPSDPTRLVPIGMVGELLLEGPVLADGYLYQPSKTDAAFIPAPQWLVHVRPQAAAAGVRLYRTGDLVQYRADGAIRYVGRRDTQVKIRGQRVELGELEHQARRLFPGTSEVIADVVNSPALHAQSTLVAFICNTSSDLNRGPDGDGLLARPTTEWQHSILTLRRRLEEVLPSYMIPSLMLPLRHVPRNLSGKTDRLALHRLAAGLSREEVDRYRAASVTKQPIATKTEKILQEFWSCVLDVKLVEIGAQDNFFHLGGDSIRAMKLAAMARRNAWEVTVAEVFQYPVLSSLAAQLTWKQTNGAQSRCHSDVKSLLDSSAGREILQQGRDRALVPEGCEVLDILPTTGSQSFLITRYPWTHFIFNLDGPLSVDRLKQACSAVIVRHSVLRTLFLENSNGMMQIILQNLPVPFVHKIVSSDLEQTVQSLIQREQTLAVTQAGIPLSFHLLSPSGNSTHVFIVRLSHAQYDGISIPGLFKDISDAYQGESLKLCNGFHSFVNARGPADTANAHKFWREFLQGSIMANLPVPEFVHGVPSSNPSVTHRSTPIPQCPEGITLATLVKAACAMAICRATGLRDITFGQVVDGRSLSLPGIESILGPCINYLPMRIDLTFPVTIKEFLEYVQSQHVRCLPFDTTELREIVQHCTSWAPMTDYGFILQHQNINTALSMPLDGPQTAFSAVGRLNPGSEIWISTTPTADTVEVQICTDAGRLSMELMDNLAESLCDAIQALSQFPAHQMQQYLSQVSTTVAHR